MSAATIEVGGPIGRSRQAILCCVDFSCFCISFVLFYIFLYLFEFISDYFLPFNLQKQHRRLLRPLACAASPCALRSLAAWNNLYWSFCWFSSLSTVSPLSTLRFLVIGAAQTPRLRSLSLWRAAGVTSIAYSVVLYVQLLSVSSLFFCCVNSTCVLAQTGIQHAKAASLSCCCCCCCQVGRANTSEDELLQLQEHRRWACAGVLSLGERHHRNDSQQGTREAYLPSFFAASQ